MGRYTRRPCGIMFSPFQLLTGEIRREMIMKLKILKIVDLSFFIAPKIILELSPGVILDQVMKTSSTKTSQKFPEGDVVSVEFYARNPSQSFFR